jgi:hypothetical protein
LQRVDVNNNQLVEALKTISQNSEGFRETMELRRKLGELKESRSPFYLTGSEFDEILKWKLDSQYPRSRELRKLNLDSVVVPVTKAAFEVRSESFEYEVDLKLRILSSVRGVATPISSAVLALTNPERYAVVDSVLWEALFGEEKQAFSSKDYLKFLRVIRELAEKADLDMQSTEHALWIHLIN